MLSSSLGAAGMLRASAALGLWLVLCAVLAAPAAAQFTQGSFNFYGSGNNQYDFSHCLDGSGSGSIFATGSTDGTALGQSTTGSGSYDWITVKFDRNNGFLTRTNNNPVLRFLYTTGVDEGHSCVSDTSGAVYVAGTTSGTLGTGSTCTNGNRDTVVAKYDNNMNLLWTVQYDLTGNCNNDFAVRILLFGTTLYIVGDVNSPIGATSASWLAYLLALNTADGSKAWTTPVYYGSVSGISLGVKDASVDANGNIVIAGGWSSANLPSSHTVNGTLILGATAVGSVNGYVASFDSLGNLRWQLANAAGSYSQMLTVTTDATGATYAGGYTQGSLRGATYSGTSTLPLMQKIDVNGNVLWTVIYPGYNYQGITHVVTDNIGAVYWLDVDISNYQCYGSYYSAVIYTDTDYQCSSPYINIFKTDVNGAVQYTGAFSTGIAQSFTIDNSGLLTIAGDISPSFSLHGTTAPFAGWNGFVDQQSINYNCSCSNLASLVTQMSQLLNISTS